MLERQSFLIQLDATMRAMADLDIAPLAPLQNSAALAAEAAHRRRVRVGGLERGGPARRTDGSEGIDDAVAATGAVNPIPQDQGDHQRDHRGGAPKDGEAADGLRRTGARGERQGQEGNAKANQGSGSDSSKPAESLRCLDDCRANACRIGRVDWVGLPESRTAGQALRAPGFTGIHSFFDVSVRQFAMNATLGE